MAETGATVDLSVRRGRDNGRTRGCRQILPLFLHVKPPVTFLSGFLLISDHRQIVDPKLNLGPEASQLTLYGYVFVVEDVGWRKY